MGIPILGEIIGAVKDIVSEVVVDKDKRDELNIRLQELGDRADERIHEQLMGQIQVNTVEASHRSIFVAGWRPFIGWGGGAALIYNTLVAPAFNLPVADLGFLQTVLMGILGLGAMRSFDKVKGVADDRPFKGKVIKNVVPENAPWAK